MPVLPSCRIVRRVNQSTVRAKTDGGRLIASNGGKFSQILNVLGDEVCRVGRIEPIRQDIHGDAQFLGEVADDHRHRA